MIQLLAQVTQPNNPWGEVGAAFRGERRSADGYLQPIVVVLTCAATVLFVFLAVRTIVRGLNASAGPLNLFRAVLRKMGIGIIDRGLLARAAQRSNLAHPAAMLLSPTLFDRAVGSATPGGWTHRRLQRVRSQIFLNVPA